MELDIQIAMTFIVLIRDSFFFAKKALEIFPVHVMSHIDVLMFVF